MLTVCQLLELLRVTSIRLRDIFCFEISNLAVGMCKPFCVVEYLLEGFPNLALYFPFRFNSEKEKVWRGHGQGDFILSHRNSAIL